jgi:RNA polymerase sigma-70 factor, ECF subfamily
MEQDFPASVSRLGGDGRCDFPASLISQEGMDSRSDADLVRATIDGEVEAFASLVHRYRDVHARFAVRMLGSHDDAEDALQSAFVRAFRALRSCRDPERFGAWLYQIVVNEARSHVKRRSRRERWYVRDAAGVDGLSDERIADSFECDGFSREVQRALDHLVAEQREAFLLKHVEELSYEEIAEITGGSIPALKMRVKRACERLRELLEVTVHV